MEMSDLFKYLKWIKPIDFCGQPIYMATFSSFGNQCFFVLTIFKSFLAIITTVNNSFYMPEILPATQKIIFD